MRFPLAFLLLAALLPFAPAQTLEIFPLNPTSDDEITLQTDIDIPTSDFEVEEVNVDRDGNTIDVEVLLGLGDIIPFGGSSQLEIDIDLGMLEPGDYTVDVRVELEGVEIHDESLEFTVLPGNSARLEDLLDHLVNDAPLDFGDANGDARIDAADVVTVVNAINGI